MNTLACAECGAFNRASARFCNECATAFAGSAAVSGEPEAPARVSALPRPLAGAWSFIRGGQTGLLSLLRTAIIVSLIVGFVFGVYYSSLRLDTYGGFDNPRVVWEQPVVCCQFYAFLADAIMNHGTLDLAKVGASGDEHYDIVSVDGEVYLPYQPMPAVILMPFIAVWGIGLTQSNVSLLVGALNVALFFYILRLLGASRQTKLLLVPFFAFGTQNFYSAVTGSLWFYNHTVATFFLLLAVIFLIRRDSPILTALALGGAALSRQATVLAIPAFVFLMIEQRRPGAFRDFPGMLANLVSGRLSRFRQALARLVRSLWNAATDRRTVVAVSLFVITLIPFAAITLWYNEVRFGDPLDSGISGLYDKYQGVGYTAYLSTFPTAERFAEFDLRNIPLHLYTIFLAPPTFEPSGTLFRPSEFGTSVLLTSPPLVFGALVKRKDSLKVACWMALLLVPIPTLLYYSQGWVQFGYRYLMDYLPFLMILTTFGFEDNRSPAAFRVKVVLVLVSLFFGFWGRWWGNYE